MISYNPIELKNLESTVFTNGCFDIVHAGHIAFFKKAKEFGKYLIVGVNSDDSIKKLKGNNRPIIKLEHRLILLDSIKYIDYLTVFEETSPLELIKLVKPNVLLKGSDWKNKGGIIGKDFVESYGGIVEYLDLIEGISSSIIIDRVKNA
jgi:rfaE bifunctional protein nucleotidyltransferase chain/domain